MAAPPGMSRPLGGPPSLQRDPKAKAYEYRDKSGAIQGPFSAEELAGWMASDWFPR